MNVKELYNKYLSLETNEDAFAEYFSSNEFSFPEGDNSLVIFMEETANDSIFIERINEKNEIVESVLNLTDVLGVRELETEVL